jgi:hypothetical protein
MAADLAVVEDQGQGIGQKPDHGQHHQRRGLMDRGVFEVAFGGDGLKNFRIDSPAAAAELMDEQRRDRAEFEISGVEVGALTHPSAVSCSLSRSERSSSTGAASLDRLHRVPAQLLQRRNTLMAVDDYVMVRLAFRLPPPRWVFAGRSQPATLAAAAAAPDGALAGAPNAGSSW